MANDEAWELTDGHHETPNESLRSMSLQDAWCAEIMDFRLLGLFAVLWVIAIAANAGNCLVQGQKTIGDCRGVHVGPGKPLVVKESGSFSGNYSHVVISKGVRAYVSGNADSVVIESKATLNLSGNADSVVVKSGATLYLSGNSDSVSVYGIADISGNADWITAHKGSKVIINGIVAGVSGSGMIIKNKGAIVGGVYIK